MESDLSSILLPDLDLVCDLQAHNPKVVSSNLTPATMGA
jgi:hypothetical protein